MGCLFSLEGCLPSKYSQLFAFKIRLIGQMSFHTFHFEMKAAEKDGATAVTDILSSTSVANAIFLFSNLKAYSRPSLDTN